MHGLVIIVSYPRHLNAFIDALKYCDGRPLHLYMASNLAVGTKIIESLTVRIEGSCNYTRQFRLDLNRNNVNVDLETKGEKQEVIQIIISEDSFCDGGVNSRARVTTAITNSSGCNIQGCKIGGPYVFLSIRQGVGKY